MNEIHLSGTLNNTQTINQSIILLENSGFLNADHYQHYWQI